MKKLQPQGFNALELIVAMAIVAIILATTTPSFKHYSWNLRMKTAMDGLQTDLNMARSRSISHNFQTVICPADNANECSGLPQWQDGWIVFTDLNGDRQFQTGEPLLKRAGATEFLNINSSRSRSYLRFYSNGTAPGSNISIVFCDQRGAEYAGAIMVSNSGRIRMETNGIDATENCP
jgi:type IV fimbrial biogenesis protein FimT